jgi:hypothetical protein
MYCGGLAFPFPKKLNQKAYLVDGSQAVVTVTLPSLLCLEFPEERGELKTTMSSLWL